MCLSPLILLGSPRLAQAVPIHTTQGPAIRVLAGPVESPEQRRKNQAVLKKAQSAIRSGKYELAESLLQQAEASGTSPKATLNPFALTTEKLRRELNQAQKEKGLASPSRRAPLPKLRSDVETSTADRAAPSKRVSGEGTGEDAAPNLLSATENAEKPQANHYLRKSREALRNGNTAAAVAWYRKAIDLNVTFADDEDSPQRLANDLMAAGVAPKLLAPQPKATNPSAPQGPNAAALAQHEEQIPAILRDSPPPMDRLEKVATEPNASQIVENPYATTPAPPLPNNSLSFVQRNGSPLPASSSPHAKGPADPQADHRAAPSRGMAAGKNLPAHIQVKQLVAQAQAALNQGQWDRAQELAEQANAISVPEEAFGPGEVRPWMMLVELSQHRNRRAAPGSVPTPGQDPAKTAATPAPANNATEAAGLAPVVHSTYNADTDTSYNATLGTAEPAGAPQAPQATARMISDEPAAAAGPEDIPELSPASLPDLSPSPTASTGEDALTPPPAAAAAPVLDAMQLYQKGAEALARHDLEAARLWLQQAWERREELDPGIRQRLQEQLPGLAATAKEGAQPSAPSAPPAALAESQQTINRLFHEVTREASAAIRQRESDPLAAWERMKKLRRSVVEAEVDDAGRAPLLARVDRHMEDIEKYIEQNRARIELDERNRQVLHEIDRTRQQKLRSQEKLAALVDEFNGLMKENRFAEAEVKAKQARALDPENPVVVNMTWKVQFARQLAANISRADQVNVGTLGALGATDESGTPFDDRFPVEFPKAWGELSKTRQKALREQQSHMTQAEIGISQSLDQKINVNFKDATLRDVAKQLADTSQVNIYLDEEGLKTEGVTSDETVSLTLRNPVSLRSVLNLILSPLQLGFVIQDEVLRITSEQERRAEVVHHTYHVADLITPIPNFSPSYDTGLPGAIRDAFQAQATGLVGGTVQQVPLAIAQDTPAGGGNVEPSILSQQLGNAGGGAVQRGAPQNVPYGPGGAGGGAQADFDSLISLIESTIEPDSCLAQGGQGAIEPFDGNLSLVISQTQEAHEKIADLLKQLRRLQDLQVTIEVRFITLSDNFFERVGVDFDFDIDDNSGVARSDLVSGNIDDNGPAITVGLDPTGQPTADLDLSFTQGSFGASQPQFGGFDPGSAANFGFAILSDIEAFFVIQAAQGDTRSNVMQAPKVTLFNGQQAFVSDTSSRPFVTSVIPVVGDFAAAHQPIITVLNEGTSLSVQAVVSSDRRFIRLTLVPIFSKIGEVEEFTFTGRKSSNTGTTVVDPTDPEDTVTNEEEEVIEGTTVQLPTFAFTTVSTTVSVPDGGTVLLGGIKRLSESRVERGVPLMSKLPYIDRLFRNVGIGRQTESLMMMVTPRIIILEEEEARQVGSDTEQASG